MSVNAKGTTATVTNALKPGKVSVTVIKIWDDARNRDNIRPDTLTVTLMNGDTVVQEVTLSAAKGWTATIVGLDETIDGKPITYTWVEGELPEGYTLDSTMVNGNVTTLVNLHQIETTPTPPKTPETTTTTAQAPSGNIGDCID